MLVRLVDDWFHYICLNLQRLSIREGQKQSGRASARTLVRSLYLFPPWLCAECNLTGLEVSHTAEKEGAQADARALCRTGMDDW